MLKKIRAITAIGMLWAASWAVAGFAIEAWRFLAWPGLDRTFWNFYPWLRAGVLIGGFCGFVAGATFGMMLAILPPLTGVRLSRRWSAGYGIASGLAASLYVLLIGWDPASLPFFATVFSLTGGATAFTIASIDNRDISVHSYREPAG